MVVYLNKEHEKVLPSEFIFYIEEMASGNYMTAHLDENKDLFQTINDLEMLYDNRIQFSNPDFNMILVDYYICKFTIDNILFCIDYDYGLVTISPDDEKGNIYIREMVDYFNKL